MPLRLYAFMELLPGHLFMQRLLRGVTRHTVFAWWWGVAGEQHLGAAVSFALSAGFTGALAALASLAAALTRAPLASSRSQPQDSVGTCFTAGSSLVASAFLSYDLVLLL